MLLTQALAGDRVNRQTEDIAYRAYRVSIHAILLGLVVFFLAGNRIVWNQCLTGFLWRAWLLLYALPWWVAAYGVTRSGFRPRIMADTSTTTKPA